MKKSWNYYKIKWTAFFVTVFILGLGLTALYMARPQKTAPTPQLPQQDLTEDRAGHYSNTAFGALIEKNLSELAFIKEICFSGKDEGHFAITGTLSDPKRLAAVCPELAPFSMLLNVLKGESVTINGHIGEDDEGNGCFVADTITFSGHTLPAGVATDYIEEYTGLNDLLEVPVGHIALNEEGITFKEVPTAIRIASYK